MSLERIALVSDVHGNLTALDAVLDDIENRGVGRVINLGDFVGKGPVYRERQACSGNGWKRRVVAPT
jgi:predicted phosphodiesterase